MNLKNKTAFFPGSFDPFHNGHKFVVESALKDFDHIFIVISWNENKVRKSSFDQAFENISNIYKDEPRVEILVNNNDWTWNVAKILNCNNIIRGYRNIKDIAYENDLRKKILEQNPELNFHYYHNQKIFK